MYNFNDTITAISSASPSAAAVAKSIIRLSGPLALKILNDIFHPNENLTNRTLAPGKIRIDNDLEADAVAYTFYAPNTYTGENLTEIHTTAASPLISRILKNILKKARLAGPGEFTMRAYLNGKIDLTQAEAVARIVAGSNKFQLAAAEKLLAGNLGKTTQKLRAEILDTLTLIEAGMDFSTEDIEFITHKEAVQKITETKDRLSRLLNSSIHYEEMIDLPAVGLAGAPNAGKSSLINALLNRQRSIVSSQQATTRDVLTSLLELRYSKCAVFDCPGLEENKNSADILDTLMRQGAVEALKNAQLILFCVDCTKKKYSRDLAIFQNLAPKDFIIIATKSDLLTTSRLTKKLTALNNIFSAKPLPISAQSAAGLEELKKLIDEKISTPANGRAEADEKIAITQRHRKIVEEAIKNLTDAAEELNNGADEFAAMLMRQAWQSLAGLESENIDEKILEKIFSNFCVGK